MERLFDPERADGVDPSEYSFRLSIKLETGDQRYKELVNSGLWVGSGARTGSEGWFMVRGESACSLTRYSDLRRISCGVEFAHGNSESSLRAWDVRSILKHAPNHFGMGRSHVRTP